MLRKYNFFPNDSFLYSQIELHKNTVNFSCIMSSFTNNFEEYGKRKTLKNTAK